MALTGKKRAFADAVLAGFSNKEAAIRAGYSAATAAQAGARLVKDKDVAAYLAVQKKTRPTAAPAPPTQAAAPSATFDINAALMHSDPKAFLLAAMNDKDLDAKFRIDAAKALMPFTHKKLGEGGKKQQTDDEAKKVAGRFGAAAPPPLKAVK
jgi:phage terminase small subunit